MPVFRIPKQSDQTLIEALFSIGKVVSEFDIPFQITLRTPGPSASEITIKEEDYEKEPIVQLILAEKSNIIPELYFRTNNHNAIQIHRQSNHITDQVTVADDANWYNNLQISDTRKRALTIRLVSLVQTHLHVANAEAALTSGTDQEWTRYRDSQIAILNSLQETQRSVLDDFSRQSIATAKASKEHLEQQEIELQNKYKTLEEDLNQRHDAKITELDKREEAILEREKKFNTKEARYVARSEQQRQIEEIKGWLQEWSLTKGTRSKRYVVISAYLIGVTASGLFAYWYGLQSMEIIASSGAALSWWQWALLSLKSIFPFAAFVTFVIYFIRWSSEWARQHADEEFRNRARVLDIGRTAWLLEAVRDAQDSNKELPSDLLRELSRNLFAYSPGSEVSDLHPQAVSDLLMQGLNSLRVKAADGTEVEAKRGKA